MTHYYQLYDVNIKSELDFPELEANKISIFDEGIRIKFNKSPPKPLKNPMIKGLYYQMNHNAYWQHIPSIGYFTIHHGKKISVFPQKNTDEDSLREALLTMAFQTALIQKGYWVMQGTSVKVNDGCFILMGASGAGKSTLAAAFWKKGYSILSDDLVVINNEGLVLSGYPYLKLWFEALHALDVEAKFLKKIRPTLHKYYLPLSSQHHTTPLPIKAIYFLQDNNSEDYQYEPITGLKKVQVLQNWMRRKYREPEIARKYLSTLLDIAHQIHMESIIRPHQDFKLNECVDYLEAKHGKN